MELGGKERKVSVTQKRSQNIGFTVWKSLIWFESLLRLEINGGDGHNSHCKKANEMKQEHQSSMT